MSKDINDSKGSRLMADVMNERKAGYDNTRASEMRDNSERSAQHHSTNSSVNLHVEPKRGNHVEWESNGGTGISQFGLIMNVVYETPRQKTQIRIRRWRGIGKGRVLSSKDCKTAFGKKIQRGGGVVVIDQDASGTKFKGKAKNEKCKTAAPKQRLPGRKEKNERTKQAVAADAVATTASFTGAHFRCGTCKQCFTFESGLAAHTAAGKCKPTHKERPPAPVPTLVITKNSRNAAAKITNGQHHVCVSLTAHCVVGNEIAASRLPAGFGFELEARQHDESNPQSKVHQVVSVTAGTSAGRCMQVKPGLALESIGEQNVIGKPLATVLEVLSQAAATGSSTVFVFRRRMRLLDRGYARFKYVLPRKRRTLKQLRFMVTVFNSAQRISHSVAADAMRSDVSYGLKFEPEQWLQPSQIKSWNTKQAKFKKTYGESALQKELKRMLQARQLLEEKRARKEAGRNGQQLISCTLSDEDTEGGDTDEDCAGEESESSGEESETDRAKPKPKTKPKPKPKPDPKPKGKMATARSKNRGATTTKTAAKKTKTGTKKAGSGTKKTQGITAPSDMKVAELQSELRRRKCGITGLKAVLVKRLQEAVAEEEQKNTSSAVGTKRKTHRKKAVDTNTDETVSKKRTSTTGNARHKTKRHKKVRG